MLLRAVAVGEKPHRLDHELDLQVSPREPGGILLGEDLELGLPGRDGPVADLDVFVELPEDGVVLEQVSHRLRVAEIVDRDDLEVPAALEVRPEEIPPDPPEAVDPHPRLSHAASLNDAPTRKRRRRSTPRACAHGGGPP